MDAKTAEILCKINTAFYRKHADSFSATRHAPWPGWGRCLAVIKEGLHDSGKQGLTVFDLACGNLRFEAFLEKELPETDVTFYAVDNCDDLVPRMPSVAYQSLDIVGALLDGRPSGTRSLDGLLAAPSCDLSVSFGFMHHIPLDELREGALATLVGRTCPGGYVIVSFWQFMNNKDLAGKAQATHVLALGELGLAGLDENDYLLGWKNLPGEYRYCHSFSDAEIDHLIEAVSDKAAVVARFRADGRTDDLNTYVVFQVR